MKKFFFIFLFFNVCLSNDAVDARRIEFHRNFNDTIDEYISKNRCWSVIRSVPFFGQVIDFGYCMQLKKEYHRLFSTDVSNQEQWNDYVARLNLNEKKINKLFTSLFLRTIIDCGITVGSALGNLALLYSHKDDHNTHIFVYMYATGTFLRGMACITVLWEKYRILKNSQSNPRFKVIALLDQPNAEAEELLNVTV